MSEFIGNYLYSIDNKNRLFIPRKLRKGIKSYVLTCGLEGCLFAYPPDGWNELKEKLKTLPFTRQDTRKFLRVFLSGANKCPLDSQGRVLVPKNLIQYSKIKKETVIIGVLDRIEIWAKEVWKKYEEEAIKKYAEVAEKLNI